MKNDFLNSEELMESAVVPDNDESTRQHSQRQAERKARQLCRQVQRALNLAIADRFADSVFNELFVEEVVPAPDCGRLLVYVLVPDHFVVSSAIEALGREMPGLRAEVAMAITRKRAPELCFVPIHLQGADGDE